MKQTVNESDFIEAFRAHDRMANFGYAGLKVLFEYLEEMERSTGEELELDVVALCCDYSMLDPQTIASEYGVDIAGLDDDDRHAAVMDYLNENTQVVGECDEGIIFAAF